MPEIIEIEGNVARIVSKTISRQIPLSEILKHVERTPDITVPTLPRTAVFVSFAQVGTETRMNILCELQPSTRAITKNMRRRNPRGLRRYRLSMPWTYFWFYAVSNDRDPSTTFNWSVYDAQVFYAKDQYADINSPMIVAPLPNLDSNGVICYGSTSVPVRQSLANQLDQRVNEWYLTDFNDDLDGQVRLPYGETTLRRWVTESRDNPTSWRDWPEFSDPTRIKTVKSLLETRSENMGIDIPLTERFNAGGFIPPVELPLTFGAWEEWWETIPPEQRHRAKTSLENIQEDSPEFVTPEIENFIEDDNDDGGVPV